MQSFYFIKKSFNLDWKFEANKQKLKDYSIKYSINFLRVVPSTPLSFFSAVKVRLHQTFTFSTASPFSWTRSKKERWQRMSKNLIIINSRQSPLLRDRYRFTFTKHTCEYHYICEREPFQEPLPFLTPSPNANIELLLSGSLSLTRGYS